MIPFAFSHGGSGKVTRREALSDGLASERSNLPICCLEAKLVDGN